MLSKDKKTVINTAKGPGQADLVQQIAMLKQQLAQLKNQLDASNLKCSALEQLNAELDAKLHYYEEQQRLALLKKYGNSSEKINPRQISLFIEPEDSSDPEVEEPELEEKKTYTRKKKTRADKQDKLDI